MSCEDKKDCDKEEKCCKTKNKENQHQHRHGQGKGKCCRKRHGQMM